MTPFEGDGVWLRCALHAHTTNSDGELAPDMLVRHYEWAGYDVLAITDHWVRTVEPLDAEAARHPVDGAERASRGPEHDAHVLALGVEADPEPPGRRSRRSQEVVAWIAENGGVPYLAHTYWSGLRTDAVGGLRGPRSGSRSGTRAASSRSAAATRRCTGTRRSSAGARSYALATDDSHHPGYDSGFAWTMGARGRALAGGGARRAAQRPLLRLDRAGDPRRRARRRRRRRALQPAQSVTLVSSRASRRARERRPARLSERVDDPRARRGGPDHRVPARAAARSRRTAGSRSPTPRGRKAWTNPLWTSA